MHLLSMLRLKRQRLLLQEQQGRKSSINVSMLNLHSFADQKVIVEIDLKDGEGIDGVAVRVQVGRMVQTRNLLKPG
jgi:hypothetical protein